MRRAFALGCLAFACGAPARPTGLLLLETDYPKPLWFAWDAAPWLEPRTEPWSSDSVYRVDGDVVALGAHLALVGVKVNESRHVVALDEARGAVGIFDIAHTEWVGVDGEDRVYRVLEGGVFQRARDATAAVKGDWEQRAALPFAERFATAGVVVAATDGDAVYVSLDGAASFRHTVPLAGADVTKLFVRHDGVLVANTWRQGVPEVVFISRDRGANWARSSLQTDGIDQLGGWIRAHCAGAVLSSDAKTWVETSRDFDTRALARAVDIREDLVAYASAPLVNQSHPPLPGPGDARRISGHRPCGALHETYAPNLRLRHFNISRCRGVECLLYRTNPQKYPTRTKVELLTDGLCRESDDRASDECKKGEELVRAPHALVIDHDAMSARVVDLPSGCRPVSVRSGGGISILVCEGRERLFVADRGGEWHAESGLSVVDDAAKKELEIAEDGTLMVTDGIREGRIREAWVRSPSPLGDREAWRHLRYPDAVGYTVARSGRALVATSKAGEAFDRLTLFLDEPNAAPKKLVQTGLDGRRLHHFCATHHAVRLLLEDSGRFEVHEVKNGRLSYLGVAPAPGEYHHESVQLLSRDLCTRDLLLVTNDAQRR